MPNLRLFLVAAFAVAFAALAAPAQVPQLINYQGRVAVSGVNFDGTGQFKLALVDGTGTTTYWSNDGSSTAGSSPAAAVSLTVSNGLYSVLLGDAMLANMTAIPATVFTNPDVRLRVWFNDGAHGWQLLAPDQRIASVGYAMIASGVSNGAITSAAIADGAVGSTQLAAGAVQAGNIAAGAVINSRLANSAITINTGTGLTGGGNVALGGTISLSNSGVTTAGPGLSLSGGTVSIPAGGVTNSMLGSPSISINAGTGLSGGGNVALGGTITLSNTGVTTAGSGLSLSGNTLSVATGGLTNSMLANPGIAIVTGTGLSGGSNVALGGAITLSNTGVTAAGPGLSLSGGTVSIPAGGVTNAMHANSAITISTGTGLVGGGIVALGGSITLSNAGVTTAGPGLSLSGGTVSIPAGGVTNSMLGSPSISINAGTGLSGGGNVALGGTITLSNAGVTTAGQGLSLSGNTVSVAPSGVTNGMLANPDITIVTTGIGLSGGGRVALGGVISLSNSGVTAAGPGLLLSSGTVSIPAGGVSNSMLSPDLDAAKISTGKIADARLSANVALLDGSNIFIGANSFGSGAGRSGFDATGRLGLGTTDPSEQLQVAVNARVDGSVYSPAFNSLPATADGNSVSIGAGQAGGGWSSAINAYSTNNGGNLTLSAGGAGHWGHGGDVTINAGNAFDTGSVGGSVYIKAGGLSSWTRGCVAFYTGGAYPFDMNSPIERMRIAGDGKVGIGTSTPAATLEIVAGGTTLADGWSVRSSRRWKTNIHPIENALSKVQNLRGVTYDWRDGRRNDIGLIAEEVGAVVPEVVIFEANGRDARSVDYQRLVAVLIEAMKEQEKKISAMQEEITTLQKSWPAREPSPGQ